MLERGNGVVVGKRNPLLGGVLVLLILVSEAHAQLDILAQKVNPYSFNPKSRQLRLFLGNTTFVN